MIRTSLLTMCIILSTANAMEKEVESAVFSVKTSDEVLVPISSFFIGHSSTLKGMYEDLGISFKYEVSLPELESFSLKQVIHLAQIYNQQKTPAHVESVFQHVLKDSKLPLLAHIVGIAYYLGCNYLFPSLLSIVSEKIYQCIHKAKQLELLDAVLPYLPEECQKKIQEILLLKYALIRDFINVRSFFDETGISPDKKVRTAVDETNRYLKVYGYESDSVHIYDIAHDKIKKIGFFKGRWDCVFSKNGKYMFYIVPGMIGNTTYTVILYDLEAAQIHYPITAFGTGCCKFSEDSRFLCVEDHAYNTQTGEKLPAKWVRSEKTGKYCYEFTVDNESIQYTFERPHVRVVGYDHLKFENLKKEQRDIFCAQLPWEILNGCLEVVINKDSHYVSIVLYKEDLQRSKLLIVYDISNIYSIRTIIMIPDVTVCAFYGTELLVVTFANMVSHFDFEKKKLACKKVHYDEIILGKDGKSFITINSANLSTKHFKKVSYFYYLESINEFVECNLPLDFVPYKDGQGKYHASVNTVHYLANDFTLLARGGNYKGGLMNEIITIPFPLIMNKCKLKQLLIMAACQNDPQLLRNPYYKECIDSVDSQLLALSGIAGK